MWARFLRLIFFIPVMCLTAIIAMFFVVLTPFVALAMWLIIGRVNLENYAVFAENVSFYILDKCY